MKAKTLCQDCRFLERTVFDGNKGKAYCKKLYERLKSYAIKCRHFQDINQPTLDDMYASAWILTKSRKAGYVSPTLIFDEPKNDEVRRHVKDEDVIT